MNSNTFFRLINKTSKIFNYNVNYARSIQTLGTLRMAANASISQSKKERETFQDVLPCIMDTVLRTPYFAEVPDVANWIRRVLDYNLAGGKKTRGLTTVLAYEMLEEQEKITEESLRLARVMGWCVEMLQAYLLVLDDVMDGSTTRRGVPCWYRIPDVGLGAVNDSILIYTAIFNTLKTYFGDSPNYTNILELFNETLLFTSIGQHLDYTMAHRNKNDYSLFTIERYYAIVKYKTAFYSYKLPCFLALYMTNRSDKKAQEAAQSVLLDIGKYFQVQDDYIDCFSDESVSGKAGTDIQEGKCTWLAVNALQRCNPEQRALFEELYGSKEPEKVQRIKQLYEELQLPQLYKDFEQSTYERIVQNAKSLPDTTLLLTSIGQHLDYTMAHRNKNDYSLFTIERYYAIVKYKTAFYSYKLPCFLALYMTNRSDKKAQEAAQSVLLDIGKYFQVQDDYIDCFSDESVSGKAGTDIQEGKCTWLAVNALQRCNPEQRALFEELYGSKEPEKVQRIKQLYEELQLPQLYKDFEQSTYERIVQNAKSLPDTVGANFPKLIIKLLDMIYNRKQ